MSNTMQNEYIPDYISPPGETLLETLDALGMSQAELAGRTGRPRKTINEIIKGKTAITPETALQFERVLGIHASFWNNRERFYSENLARIEEQKRLEKQVKWLKTLPIKAMAKKGWIRSFNNKVQQLMEVLNFFGVSSPEHWDKLICNKIQAALRTSPAFEIDSGALAAWLRKGEIDARHIKCAPYDNGNFRMSLRDVRSLTVEPPEVFQQKMVQLCAESGVAVVFIPELPKTRASGATRWLTPLKALIQLSLRYKTDDQFWFTFFHEAAHILLHGKRDVFLEGIGADNKREVEANKFASEMLIPAGELNSFIKSPRITERDIRCFASEIGIAPGIVVGRLQYDRILPYTHLNKLKRQFAWAGQ